jgi:UDP-glucose 4-epimerase
MVSTVLVTGGLGFIGSHVVVLLAYVQTIKTVIILDNLANSNLSVLDRIKILAKTNADKIKFVQGDICSNDTLNHLFGTHDIDTVMHFAALKSVSKSQKYPELYNDVNVVGTKNILNVMKKHKCRRFIYSSSATVYGNEPAPVTECTTTGTGLACNYAKNKYDMERYMIDNKDSIFKDFNITILRYFNPIGAHPSGLIGEDPNDVPNNIFPYLLRVARWINNDAFAHDIDSPYSIFTVFGDEYDTRDGTCIRDYVHVQDLARSHVEVLKNNETCIKIYNVGTGKGTTVLELIACLNKELINKGLNPLPYKVGKRRYGDIMISYAKVDKIYEQIGFKTELDVSDMCRDGIKFIGL